MPRPLATCDDYDADVAIEQGQLGEILRSASDEPCGSWAEEFCSELRSAVGADVVSLSGLNADLSLAWANDFPAGTCHGETAEAIQRLCSSHPVLRWGAHHVGSPARLSDIQPWSSFRNTALYTHVYRPLNLRYEMVMVLRGTPTPVAVAIQRTGSDFSDETAERLSLLNSVLKFAASMMWAAQASNPDIRAQALSSSRCLLTPREFQVLSFLANGARDADIARECGIAPLTAKKHVEHILVKLGAATRAGAVAVGFRQGLIPGSDGLRPWPRAPG
jgi:DNA-binding CsgD family transcriptional regulator